MTDTKAVARWDVLGHDDMEIVEGGGYILFTDHERVIGDFVEVVDVHRGIIADFTAEIETLRSNLAASRAEVERLRKDAERYRVLRAHAEHTDQYQIVPGGTMLIGYAEDEDISTVSNWIRRAAPQWRREMSDTKISEAAPIAWVDIANWRINLEANECFFTDFQDEDTVPVYLHPQPAELAEQQGADAHTLWATAQLAPGEGIEDGVQRIEQALAATGKQQVGEVQGDTRLLADVDERINTAKALGYEDDIGVGIGLLQCVRAALTARQPGIDLGQFRRLIVKYRDSLVHRRYDAKEIAEANRLLALIDQRDAAPGVQLAVWCGPMPESNGRQNWTAMLYRKGGDIFGAGSITIDRSEYPDRIRYEADRLRYLIGKRDEEPDIMEYDANAHSGYVEQPAHDIDLGRVETALRDALSYVGYRSDGNLVELAERAELWMRESRCLIDGQRDAPPGVD